MAWTQMRKLPMGLSGIRFYHKRRTKPPTSLTRNNFEKSQFVIPVWEPHLGIIMKSVILNFANSDGKITGNPLAFMWARRWTDWLMEMEDFTDIHMLGDEENVKNMYKIMDFVETYPATKPKLMVVLKLGDLKATSFENV